MMEWARTALQILLTLAVLRLCTSNPIFYESFDEHFDKSWTVSEKEEYKGVWKHSKSEGHEDFGLLVSEKAKKYGIVKQLDTPVNLKDGTIVLQYEARFQDGLECGGAYLKYLRPQDAGWAPKDFDNDSPYSIMFGPDKCGSTNKVHFILNHKNPTTGEYVEHHLKYPPSVPYDKLTHVYTAVIQPNNDLLILVDGEEKKKGNFLSADDFEPAVVPPKTIPDPDDRKPEDWDERPKISDPDAVKPEDWDEDAPTEIEDADAVKPEGWLNDEPEEIDDPESSKPEDWDEEEDGEWEAPKIDNPKCAAAPGCGVWKRPTKRNPSYKGRWHAPLIDNPGYNGIWKPQEIPNPSYFELDKPAFEPISAIGIEIWTMQDGILFDNILIANDEKVAESYRFKTSKLKHELEKEKEKAVDSSSGLSSFQKKIFDVLYKVADIPLLKAYNTKIIEVIQKGETQPNVTVGILASIIVVIITIIFKITFPGKKSAAPPAEAPATANPAAAEEKEGEGDGDKEEEKDKEDADTARPRRSRRET